MDLKEPQVFLFNVKSGDPMTIGYFNNFDNEPLNKYKKISIIKKNL
jgi:hypothetical protein